MDSELKRIIDERLAKGEIDFEEHRRLIQELDKPSSGLYAVLLQAASSSKIETIKVVRECTGSGLKEAKQLVEAAPAVIAEGLDRAGAEAIARNLLDIGARALASPQEAPALQSARKAAAQAKTQAASGCLVAAIAVAGLLLLAGVLPAIATAWAR